MLLNAHFVADLGQIRDKLTADLVDAGRSSGLVVVVFANARKKFSQDEIHPLVPYWNYRSRDYVSFFFPGYVGDESGDNSEYSTVFDPSATFDQATFTETIEQFERETNWIHQGDTPIVICRGFLQYDKRTKEPRALLDFHSIIELELERAIRNDAIDSIDVFFEAIIKAGKETPGGDVQWKLAASLGASALRKTLVEAITSALPPGAKHIFDAIRFFRSKSGNHDL